MHKKGLKEVGLLYPMKNKQRGDLSDLLAVFDHLLGGSGRAGPNSF